MTRLARITRRAKLAPVAVSADSAMLAARAIRANKKAASMIAAREFAAGWGGF